VGNSAAHQYNPRGNATKVTTIPPVWMMEYPSQSWINDSPAPIKIDNKQSAPNAMGIPMKQGSEQPRQTSSPTTVDGIKSNNPPPATNNAINPSPMGYTTGLPRPPPAAIAQINSAKYITVHAAIPVTNRPANASA
jgi:hypothetical protein